MSTKSPLKLVSSGYDILREEGTREFIRHTLQWLRIRNKNSLELSCDGVTAIFDTSSDVAKDWFYPRYLDGSLHEPAMTRELLSTLNNNTIFYDVGALMGYYSVFATNICTEGEVHSFEVDPRFVDSIQRSLTRNGTEAEVIHRAASDVTGKKVHYGGDVGLTSISHNESGDMVETLSLDDYAESNKPPDVMKVDVEGFEYKVLCGAKNMLKNGNPSTLFVEVHPSMLQDFGDDLDDVLDILNRYDYSITVMENHRGQSASESEISNIEDNVVLRCHCR